MHKQLIVLTALTVLTRAASAQEAPVPLTLAGAVALAADTAPATAAYQSPSL